MDSKKIAQAMTFAAIAHDGVYRKGTKIPYISHPIEAALIVMTLTDDEEVIMAAVLHDVVEDTEYTIADIRERFGDRVAELVGHESEDKMRELAPEDSWKIRKQAALERLSHAPLEAKIIAMGDKLSNIRTSVKTFTEKGDDMWLVFNQKDKSQQEWYYRSIAKALDDLKDTDAYREYLECVDYVFGK